MPTRTTREPRRAVDDTRAQMDKHTGGTNHPTSSSTSEGAIGLMLVQVRRVDGAIASRATRSTSAMPRSKCWPDSLSDQRSILSPSSENQSRRPLTDRTPILLILPPRFVEDATSGLQVSILTAVSGASWTRSAAKMSTATCSAVANPDPNVGKDAVASALRGHSGRGTNSGTCRAVVTQRVVDRPYCQVARGMNSSRMIPDQISV